MKALKILGIVLGSIVGLVVIVVAVVWILLSRPSGIASQVTPVVADPVLAVQLDNKWSDFNAAVRAAESGDRVAVTITQEEVTAKIKQEIAAVELPGGLTLGEVNVNLKDGKLLLAADMKFGVISGNAGLEATVENIDGKPSIVVSDVDFGSLPLPEALKDQLKNLIPADGIIAIGDLPFDITNMSIADGELVLEGLKQ